MPNGVDKRNPQQKPAFSSQRTSKGVTLQDRKLVYNNLSSSAKHLRKTAAPTPLTAIQVGPLKRSNIHVISVLKGEKKEGRDENVLKEMMVENFPNLAGGINLHI